MTRQYERVLMYVANDPSISTSDLRDNIQMSSASFAPHRIIILAETAKDLASLPTTGISPEPEFRVGDWVDELNKLELLDDIVLVLESAERYVGDGEFISTQFVLANFDTPATLSFPVAFQFGCAGLRRTDKTWGEAVSAALYLPERGEITSDQAMDFRQGLNPDTMVGVGFIHTTAQDVYQHSKSLAAQVVPRGAYAMKFEHDVGPGATVEPVGVLRPILVRTKPGISAEALSEFHFLAYDIESTQPDATSIMTSLRKVRVQVSSPIAAYVERDSSTRRIAAGLSRLQLCADRSALAWETLDGWTAAFVVEHGFHPYGNIRLGLDGAITQQAAELERQVEEFYRPFPNPVVAGGIKGAVSGNYHSFETRMFEEYAQTEEDYALVTLQRPESLATAARIGAAIPSSIGLRLHLVNLLSVKTSTNLHHLCRAFGLNMGDDDGEV